MFKRILLFLSCSLSFTVFGNHMAGGYFEYTCLGNNQYQVDYIMLRDCHGAEFSPIMPFYVKNSCGLTCGSLVYDAPLISATNVDFGCGNACGGGNTQEDVASYQIGRYRTTITLTSECSDWTILLLLIARPENVDYISENSGYHNYCVINNVGGECNSSVKISGLPFAVGCTDKGGKSLFTFNNPDGSTVEYALVPPLQGGCSTPPVPVNYLGGASAQMPIPSSSNFVLNQEGIFTFMPNVIGYSVFGVRVREYSASNTLIGEILVDGIVLSESCESGSPISFSNWAGDDDATIATQSVTTPLCSSFVLASNDNDEFVTFVKVETPSFMTHSVTYNGDGTATVTVCADFPDDFICLDATFSITVTARTNAGGCIASAAEAGSKGYYYIHKVAGAYCPDNLYFTNRNSTSGIAMPLYAHAEERIWVGDNMPFPEYNPQIEGEEGFVTVPDGGYYTAGIEILLPSCDAGNGCVTLEGNLTLEIAQGSCSSECTAEELTVSVDEVFVCGHERLSVNVTGVGPFTYELNMLGQTITQNNSDFFIHDLVSEINTGQIPYTIHVYDAIDGEGAFSGEVLGTQVFYAPVTNNVDYFEYSEGGIYETGYYYPGVPYVGTAQNPETGQWLVNSPFYIYDDINEVGPWYGATYMKLVVWNRWGTMVQYLERDLEGGTDWSFNNGEIYWNGYWWNGNGQTSSCVSPETDIATYQLEARNCATAVHQEISALPVFSCYEDPWVKPETKSMTDHGDDEVLVVHDSTRWGATWGLVDLNSSVVCAPNPTATQVTVKSAGLTLIQIRLTEMNGKTMQTVFPGTNHAELDVSELSSGVYTLIVLTEQGEKRIKLVKN